MFYCYQVTYIIIKYIIIINSKCGSNPCRYLRHADNIFLNLTFIGPCIIVIVKE